MDNATHAFAGLLMADATMAWIERRTGTPADRRLRGTIAALGVVAAELPDADLLYSGPLVGMGKLGYLLHHRGHTHTVLFAIAAALLMWWMAWALRRRGAASPDPRERVPLLVLAMAGTLSHLLLDFTNSYGVHPFWPLDNRWVYGDAVFIVEPWLWVAAIPPLLFGPRRAWSRVLLSLLLLVILAASWLLGELTQSLALAVTLGAVLWLALQRWIPAPRRVFAGIAAFCAVEAVFFASSAQAKAMVRRELTPDEHAVDIVATPGAANPFCFDALVVSGTGPEYRVRTVTIAPWSAAGTASSRAAPSCRVRTGGARLGALPGAVPARSRNGNGLTWGEEWSAPRADAIALAASRCEFAYALRFIRVPVWRHEPDGAVLLSDARFGVGGAGFTDLRVSEGACALSPRAWIPPWTPPRAELLGPH